VANQTIGHVITSRRSEYCPAGCFSPSRNQFFVLIKE
jgi:hypothetical protein